MQIQPQQTQFSDSAESVDDGHLAVVCGARPEWCSPHPWCSPPCGNPLSQELLRLVHDDGSSWGLSSSSPAPKKIKFQTPINSPLKIVQTCVVFHFFFYLLLGARLSNEPPSSTAAEPSNRSPANAGEGWPPKMAIYQ